MVVEEDATGVGAGCFAGGADDCVAAVDCDGGLGGRAGAADGPVDWKVVGWAGAVDVVNGGDVGFGAEGAG